MHSCTICLLDLRFDNKGQIQIHHTQLSGSITSEICALTDLKLNAGFNDVDYYFQADCSQNNQTSPPFIACECCSACW